jgi:hypothetical protein
MTGSVPDQRGAGRPISPPLRAAPAALSDPVIGRVLQRMVALSSLFTTAIGLLGLAGWFLDAGGLGRGSPGVPIIEPLTAMALMSCGGSLWLLRITRAKVPGGRRRRAGQVFATVAAALGLFSLSLYLVGWMSGIERFLRLHSDFPATFAGSRPDRTAPVAALDCLLVGLALLCLDRPARPGVQRNGPAQILAFAANTAALVALLDVLLGPAGFSFRLAGPAVALFLVSFAAGCARTDAGFGALLVSRSAGGVLTRRLWPAVVLVPLVIGGASWKAYSAGLVSEWTGFTMMIAAMITLLAGFTVWSAQRIDRSDGERRRAEEALREREASLTRAQAIAHIGSWHFDVARERLARSDEVFHVFGVAQGRR